MKRYLGFLILVSIVLAGVIPYINSLNNPFIWDEEEIIVGNPIIKDWKLLPHLFTTDVFGAPIKSGGFFRPLCMLTFMLDYHIWGLNTFGYHLFSIVLHALNALLLYALILRVGLERRIAWLASLLFALFPLNCESVVFTTTRVEPILGLLSLSCIILFLKGMQKSKVHFLGSAVLLILAIFTKESALALPFLILIYVFIFLKKEERQKAIFPLLMLIGIALLYCALRFLFLGNPIHRTLSLINEASLLERIYTFPRILLTYIGLALFPVVLKAEYHFVVHSARDAYVWLGTPLLLLLAVVVYKFLKPRKHTLFFSSWFLIWILPYSNVIIPLHATLMEHWAYVASPGLAVLMSMAIFGIMKRLASARLRYVVGILVAFLMLFYAVKIVERNREWRDPLVLYKTDVEKEPNSFLLHCNLGVEYFRKGMMEEAKKEFIASIEVAPGRGYDVAYNNLGVIYAREGKISEAITCYKQSIALNNYSLAYANLGELYNNLGMHEDALLVLREGVELYPLNSQLKSQLSLAEEAFKEIGNVVK